MEFLVLGPLEVRIDGRALSLGGPKQRALLALLLLNANEVVSRDRLIDSLWGERAPESAGTHQGAVRPQQLDYYLDEFSFRFNRRSSNHRGLLFYRLLEQAVQLEHVPLTAIIGGRP